MGWDFCGFPKSMAQSIGLSVLSTCLLLWGLWRCIAYVEQVTVLGQSRWPLGMQTQPAQIFFLQGVSNSFGGPTSTVEPLGHFARRSQQVSIQFAPHHQLVLRGSTESNCVTVNRGTLSIVRPM